MDAVKANLLPNLRSKMKIIFSMSVSGVCCIARSCNGFFKEIYATVEPELLIAFLSWICYTCESWP